MITISETQSRFSIIDRLTKQKLDIMTSKFQLEDEVKQAEYNYNFLKNHKKDKLRDIKTNFTNAKKNVDIEIENADLSLINLKDRFKDNQKLLDDKIKAIESALKSIETISETHSP